MKQSSHPGPPPRFPADTTRDPGVRLRRGTTYNHTGNDVRDEDDEFDDEDKLFDVFEWETERALVKEGGKATVMGCLIVFIGAVSFFSAWSLGIIGAFSPRLEDWHPATIAFIVVFAIAKLFLAGRRAVKPLPRGQAFTTPSFLLWCGMVFLAAVALKDMGLPTWAQLAAAGYYLTFPVFWKRSLDWADTKIQNFINFDKGDKRTWET